MKVKKEIADVVKKRQLTWFGHTKRTNKNRSYTKNIRMDTAQ